MAGFLSTGFNSDSWLSEAQDVFSDKAFSQKRYTPSFKAAFKELTKTYKEQIISWWEVQSLENYLKHSIVPRGLRISLTPAARCKNASLMTKWEQEATSSSLRFMQILLEQERITLEELNTKLKEQHKATFTLAFG